MIELGALLKTGLYLISGSLLYPTLALLLASFFWVIWQAGAFCSEWIERIRLKPAPPHELPAMIAENRADEALPHRVKKNITRLEELTAASDLKEIQVENLLRSATIAMGKELDRLRILVRLAPSLGLIGTLIPMGTGLAALGQGDMSRLSSDLVIAFTTTVVGLASGMAAFVLYTIKRRWVEEDLKNTELAAEMLVPIPRGGQ